MSHTSQQHANVTDSVTTFDPIARDELLDNEKDLPLLEETKLLSDALIRVIQSQTSPEVTQTIDALLAGANPQDTINEVLPTLDSNQTENLIRACSLFAQMFNIAEDRHHKRRRLAHEKDDNPASSSFEHVLGQIQTQGISRDTLQQKLDKTTIGAVLTAHPTEVQRQSVLNFHRRIREILSEYANAAQQSD